MNSQDYYWSEEWQEAEHQADEDIKAGRTWRFISTEEAISWLRSVSVEGI